MLHSAHNRRLAHDNRHGTSLVEVLVVLVILVVGIFSIARLFPGGFFSLRSAENNTFADRLAQGQLETLKQNNSLLLDAVYMYDSDGNFYANYGPDDLTGTAANPFTPTGGAADATLNDINKARYISGETFTVTAPNTSPNNTDTNGASIHVLNYGPAILGAGGLVQTTSLTAPVTLRALPPVNSGPWAAKTGNSQSAIGPDVNGDYNVPGSSDAPGDLLVAGRPNFAIDYAGQRIAVPPAAYPQFFTLAVKVGYQVPGKAATDPPTTQVVTYYYPLKIPAADASNPPLDSSSAYNGGWFDPTGGAVSLSYIDTGRLGAGGSVVQDVPTPTGATSSSWVAGSAVLTCALQPAADVPTLVANANLNPYTNPYTYAVYKPDANLSGVSMGVLAVNPRLVGQQVSVSYLAYDWHIIHEDVDVPTGQNAPIRLTLNHLKRVGDVQNDQTVYGGLFRTTDVAAGGQYDVYLVDTDTGQMQGLSATDTTNVFDVDNKTGQAQDTQVAISYQGGRLTLPSSTSKWSYNLHRHLRIYYQGDLGWAVAIQKAPSLYTLAPAGGTPGPGQYAVGGTFLQFPQSDQGKTVELDDVSYLDSNSTRQVASVVSGLITSSTAAGTSFALDLNALLPNGYTSGLQVGAVRGVSARAVVVWKERDRWKSRTLDTILTRAQ